METLEPLVDPAQAASTLQIRPRRLRQLVASGALPAVKLGPKVTRFSPRALAEFIAAGGIQGGDPEADR